MVPIPDPQSVRKFLPGLGDLIDMLTVTQLRLVRSARPLAEDQNLHDDISSDISASLAEQVDVAQIVDRAIALAHINSEIWNLKDAMTQVTVDSEEYGSHLALAHQLNGYRTHIRNELNSLGSSQGAVLLRTNTESDGLGRWVPLRSSSSKEQNPEVD
jgi:hypothetical protein